MKFDLLLQDRVAKIQQINEKYDLLNNSYISFSGGKDSLVLHHLLDMALPNNNIPRIFINTGIEYKLIVTFVKKMRELDKRIQIISTGVNLKTMFNIYGYPFKSKQHSRNLNVYQNNKSLVDDILKNNYSLDGLQDVLDRLPVGSKTVIKYLYGVSQNKESGLIYKSINRCPNKLRYQFTAEFDLKISDKCCYKLKKEPFNKYQKESGKFISLTGMRASEGGNRNNINCIVTKDDKLVKFHPLSVLDDEFMDNFIKNFNIELCELYNAPFGFKRTGCKGCPFALDLQEQLYVMKKLLPSEYAQVNKLWNKVYKEYRNINYRLRKFKQITIFDFD